MHRLTGGLILEGVTGAGKSRVLAALLKHPEVKQALIFNEDETFGELMESLKDRRLTNAERCFRMADVLGRLRKKASGRPFLLERFHPSYYALMPDWSLYGAFDESLRAMGCRVVLLDYAPAALPIRALKRPERRAADWERGMIRYFGSRKKAMEALALSRRRRRLAVKKSRLVSQVIDTSDMDWSRCASLALAFWKGDGRGVA